MRRLLVVLASLALLLSTPAAAGATPRLLVGVGRADITPLTGVYKGGWSCTCARAVGQQERLYARAIVIRSGRFEVALVTEDLFALSGGMVRDAAGLLKGLGFSEANIIDSATHTQADPAMYSFMTRQLALAIRRAYRDLRPGAVGWGQTRLLGVTQNRSLGAHLADYGITNEGANGGSPSQDPGGYPDTIDPTVNVLRIDQYTRRGREPVGIYSTFANHGTVDHENFWYYSGDHQGAAERVVEAAIRQAGHVPGSQEVINAFANSDAGDMTSGIRYSGPADAEYIGRREAGAMLAAWRAAGRAMTSRPQLALRFTRICMCGQQTRGGPIDSTPWIGKAAGAGSEEGRTIFYYDHLANEGDRLPADAGPQGDKILALDEKGSVPQAVPFTVLRIGDRLIATLPGEPTVGTGKLVRDAVQGVVAHAGMKHVVIVGYAGDYLSYFTTPPEYEQQAYEGGFTLYGHYTALALRDVLVLLAQRLVRGKPAPAPYPYDPNAGVHVSSAHWGSGAARGRAVAQPGSASRLGHSVFTWSGGGDGVDRPVDRAFVTIQRLVAGRWRPVSDDLGMQIIWASDSHGRYSAHWEVPLSAPAGAYRFLITAKRYRLASHRFRVAAGAVLVPEVSGNAVRLGYPQPFLLNDWTYRPLFAAGGTVVFVVGGRRRVVVRERGSERFPIPAGASVTIPAHAARDRYGNTNARAITVR